ncbi:glutamate racemase [Orenia metallireducens]|uniref:Glutamate racemase n=1 Tax=Orenia metallireducens TaxID=1413210 RepID=A0A285HLP1_9FIRM|nr:glutamate racemase [Orenia metallireducens]SNY36584.1 glutamate racemase [Orenia metallireducens]
MKIGFLDSGIGGLTVLKEALKILPNHEYIYYADTENVPYGIKPKNEVKNYIFNAVDFIIKQGVKAVLIACNTATSIAIKDLRQQYNIPIIGMEPAVKPAVENCDGKRVLVLATPLTLKEEKYQKLVSRLDSKDIVDSLPLPELVEFAENFVFDEEIITRYLKDKFAPYNLNAYGTIVLGCTHFPFYKSFFREILPAHIDIIDGNLATVKHLKRSIEERYSNISTDSQGKVNFYLSGNKVCEDVVLDKYMGILKS